MEEELQEGKKRDLGKIIGITLIALNFIVIGTGAYLVYANTIGYRPPVISDSELNAELNEFRKSLQAEPIMYTMPTFNTNLDGIPRRYIRMEVNLEMLDEEGFEEVISLGAEARDSINRIINNKKFQDIETVQGKLKLKNQITSSLNDFLTRGVVKNVYFSNFVVQ